MVEFSTKTQALRYVIQVEPVIRLTEASFKALRQQNRHLHIERTADGKLILTPRSEPSLPEGNDANQ